MSPVGTAHSIALPMSERSRNATRGSAGESPPVSAASAETTGERMIVAASTNTNANSEPSKHDEAKSIYSSRTAFNAATGDWTLVIERHPPEVGVTVAEQKGFISQYSAIANSPTNLRNALSMRV